MVSSLAFFAATGASIDIDVLHDCTVSTAMMVSTKRINVFMKPGFWIDGPNLVKIMRSKL